MRAIEFDQTLITTTVCPINLVGILWQDQGIFSAMNNDHWQGACRCTIKRRDLFEVKPTGGLYFLLYLCHKVLHFFFREVTKNQLDKIVFDAVKGCEGGIKDGSFKF